MTERRTFSIAFLVVFSILVVWLGLVFAPFLSILLWAIILARLTYPLYQMVLNVFHGRRSLSAAVVSVSVIALAVAPALYLAILGAQQSLEAYKSVIEWADAGGLKFTGESLSKIPGIGQLLQPAMGWFVVAQGGVELSILEGSKWVSDYLTTEAGGLAKNAVLLVTDLLLLLFTLFFLYRDGADWYHRFYEAIPLAQDHKDRILSHLHVTVTAVVRGTLLTAVAQGVVAGLTYALLGVPLPVLLGAVSALFALLPFGGTAFVWGPVAVWLLATGAILKACLLLTVGGVLIGLMDNVLYYWLTGSRARLPVLFLFFASVGGIAYFGFIGVFLGPILLAMVVAAFRIYEEEYKAQPRLSLVKKAPD